MCTIHNKDQLLDSSYRISDPTQQALWALKQAQGFDGYEMIDVVATGGWRARGDWGRDGWNLGQWPYVIVFTRQTAADAFQLAYYVEGDVTLYEYPSAELRDAAIDAIAFFHWSSNGEAWTAGISTADEMPARLCGPFSLQRLDRERGQ